MEDLNEGASEKKIRRNRERTPFICMDRVTQSVMINARMYVIRVNQFN